MHSSGGSTHRVVCSCACVISTRLNTTCHPLILIDISIHEKTYSPFSIKGINTVLNKEGFIYAAGYGNRMKPAFMLARLSEEYSIGRYRVYIAGRASSVQSRMRP